MTEYGRGPGPEPWHPEDPLYGDLGYDGGQQAPTGPPPYDDQAQYYPQQQTPQPGQHYDQWGTGQQPAYPAHDGTGQYPAQGYPGQYPPQAAHGAYPAQGVPGGYPPQGDPGQFPAPGGPVGHEHSGQYPMPGHPQHPSQGGPGQQPPYPAPQGYQGQYEGWDTGQHGQVPYGGDPGDPYCAGTGDPYGNAPADPYDYPADPHRAEQPRSRPERRREPEPVPHTDWDPGPDQGEHAFFAGGDDDDDEDDDAVDGGRGRRNRGDRRGGGGKGKKRRSGCACLVVAVVLGGGVAGVGWFGYQYYEDHFGPAPDYAGGGTGQRVTVVIPKGSGGYAIGQQLKAADVVKSVDAFVDAQKKNPKGQTIQDGVYTLSKHMSAQSAVELMLNPKSRDNLVVREGWRNAAVYQEIDKRLGLKAGTTADVAHDKASSLGLPAWAKNHEDLKDPLEGFLFPSSYAVAKGMKPEEVLKDMVSRATAEYGKLDLAGEAEKLHMDGPWQVITVASLVQAEGKTNDDYRKMAEVVYNRLKPTNTETNQYLQFDSTFNYLKGQSNIHISESEINSNHDPYNTYTRKGLTPGPIGNPGRAALDAALHPTHDGWIYFVATDGMNKTEFARSYPEFQKLKEEFNDHSGN